MTGEPATVHGQEPLISKIRSLRHDLSRIIEIGDVLLIELRIMSLLTEEQIDLVGEMQGRANQVSYILNIIVSLSHVQQKQFLVALLKTRQTHVNNYIICNGTRPVSDAGLPTDNWPLMYSIEVNLLRSNCAEVINTMDSVNGLLDEMLSAGCIDFQQHEELETCDTRIIRNKALVNMLLRRSVSDFRKFIQCLVETKQHQVVSLLCSDIAANDRPLDNEQKKRLIANYSALSNLIDTRCGLLAALLSAGCITTRHKEFIESATTRSQANKRLLDIVRRGSQSDYEKFIGCLVSSNQLHVCRVLLDDVAVVRIVAKLCRGQQLNERTLLYARSERTVSQIADHDLKQDEDQIVKQCKESLRGMLDGTQNVELRKRLKVELVNFLTNLDDSVQLIDVSEGSINLYYLCTTLTGLQTLRELFSSGRLQELATQVFNCLLHKDRSVNVAKLSWNYSDYLKSMKYMCLSRGMSVFATIYDMANCTESKSTSTRDNVIGRTCDFERLLPELVELTLMKAANGLVSDFNMVTSRAETCTLATLSAVSRAWWRKLTSRKYVKHLVHRNFKRMCSPFRCHPHQMQRLHCDADVRGMAEFSSKLYVVCAKSSIVQVFSSEPPFSRLVDFEARGLNDPNDIVVCSITSQLYIADCGQRAIWRVNLLSYKHVDKFISTQWQPWSLSTKSRRLLITPRDSDGLFIYGSDGDLLEHIKLPHYMHATHAVETTHNTCIVSHRSRLADDRLKSEHESVSEIDINGRVVRTFNSQHNDIGSIQLNVPQYLALADNNHVIVADSVNERIVVLNEDLKLKRVLINASHGQQPFKLCLSQRTGLLFVAMFRSNGIHVQRALRNS